MRRSLRSRRGFALPMTIFVVTIVTLMLSAVFVRVQVDRRIAESSGDTGDALAVAQSGLEAYFASRTTTRPPDGDSVRINVTGGYANVVANVVRQPPDTFANWTYVVRSTGFVVEPTMGADPQAQRTVAQFAQWQTGRLNVIAAFTAANRMRHEDDNTVQIHGDDDCMSEPTVLGVRTTSNSRVSRANDPGITGSPVPVLEADRGDSIATLTQIDWAATIAGGMKPDYTSFQPSNGSYPIQFVDGDLRIRNQWSSGILIVTGDLKLDGFWAIFNGVVLVGGKIDFDATGFNIINGSVVSGLNVALQGGNPPQGRIGRRNRPLWINYNSCRVEAALRSITGFQPIQGGWVDNWGSY